MNVIALYFILHVIRFIGIVSMLPLMNLVGYRIQIKTCMFLAFAGLRGAVGLSLALILTANEKIDKKVSNLILFYVAGMVILTLFINGISCAIAQNDGIGENNHRRMVYIHRNLPKSKMATNRAVL